MSLDGSSDATSFDLDDVVGDGGGGGDSRMLAPIPGFESLSTEEQQRIVGELRDQYYPPESEEGGGGGGGGGEGGGGELNLEEVNDRLNDITPPPSDFDDPVVVAKVRESESRYRRLLEKDGCSPIYPVEMEYPFPDDILQRIPEVDRQGFWYFAQWETARQGFYHDHGEGTLQRQYQDWIAFRYSESIRWAMTTESEGWNEREARSHRDKRMRATQKAPPRSYLDDMRAYQKYHTIRRDQQLERIRCMRKKLRDRKGEGSASVTFRLDCETNNLKLEEPLHRYIQQKIEALAATDADADADAESAAARPGSKLAPIPKAIKRTRRPSTDSISSNASTAAPTRDPSTTQSVGEEEQEQRQLFSQNSRKRKRTGGIPEGGGEQDQGASAALAEEQEVETRPRRITRSSKLDRDELYELDERSRRRIQPKGRPTSSRQRDRARSQGTGGADRGGRVRTKRTRAGAADAAAAAVAAKDLKANGPSSGRARRDNTGGVVDSATRGRKRRRRQ